MRYRRKRTAGDIIVYLLLILLVVAGLAYLLAGLCTFMADAIRTKPILECTGAMVLGIMLRPLMARLPGWPSAVVRFTDRIGIPLANLVRKPTPSVTVETIRPQPPEPPVAAAAEDENPNDDFGEADTEDEEETAPHLNGMRR